MSNREEVLYELGRDKVLAHEVLFGARHSDPTPKFHREVIAAWHSDIPNVGLMAFRGSAKSTRSEEAICVQAWFRMFRNCVILGESEQRSVDRLRAIKNHIETNEYAQWLFEVGPGDIWTETKITLTTGQVIQAYGRGQSLRGVKHLDSRPDLIFMDDLEDKESVSTPEQRDKVLTWYTSTVIPALDPKGRMRMAATPLHPEALAVKLSRAASWTFLTFPIATVDASSGASIATWPERFPLPAIEQTRAHYQEIGKAEEFDQEYMCQARNPATQVFTPDMIRVVPRVRSWHAVYAMYDPARTTTRQSATTGKAVWSWIGRKLVVWEASARLWMPDEIVKDIFDVERTYSPVAIGFEETGLNEWCLQPIRAEQASRGVVVPLRPLHAPKGKLDFIAGLQPYFRAGEVEFAADLPDLREQLLGFPTGRIDAPNALAYALRMRHGLPVYDGLQPEHIAVGAQASAASPMWLALNTDGRTTTAALCQVRRGVLTILADWLYEGDPGSTLPDLWQEAMLETSARVTARSSQAGRQGGDRSNLRPVAPSSHFSDYDAIGLRAAVKRLPAQLSRGGDILAGREELRGQMRRMAHGDPCFRVDERARWTLRALAGGFARDADSAEPIEGPYRVLMEGIEAFAALLRNSAITLDEPPNFAYTSDGRRYISALAR